MRFSRFREALELHQRGEIRQAIRLYKKILSRDPHNFDALHHLGLAYQAENMFSDAETMFKHCLEIDPNFSPFYNSLASLYVDKMDFSAALKYAVRATIIDASNFKTYFVRARALAGLRQFDEAIASYRKSIFLNPNSYEAYNGLGTVMVSLGLFDRAIEAFSKAISLNRKFAAAFNNRAAAYVANGNLQSARFDLENCVTLSPRVGAYWSNLSEIYLKIIRVDDAIRAAEMALQLDPQNLSFQLSMARACLDDGQYERAHQLCKNILISDPSNAICWNVLGTVLREVEFFDDAADAFKQATKDEDERRDAEFNLACLSLLRGHFLKGWGHYEARMKPAIFASYSKLGVPEWTGSESLVGKTILIHQEQGIGDIIQYCRYLPLLESLGAKLLFVVDLKLQKLLGSLNSKIDFIDPLSPELVPCDFHCLLMSLPRAFKTVLDNIPSRIPYLAPDTSRQNKWQALLPEHGFRIGICWQGSQSKIDLGRSIPLDRFFNLTRVTDVQLISLQKGNGEEQLQDLPQDIKIHVLGDEYDAGQDAFLDAAAVISNCDLVISSDTAIAHLAGSIGVKTWVALRKVPDWRWMLDRNDSPWYPSMKLFRQSTAGDWAPVFNDIENELRALLGEL